MRQKDPTWKNNPPKKNIKKKQNQPKYEIIEEIPPNIHQVLIKSFRMMDILNEIRWTP